MSGRCKACNAAMSEEDMSRKFPSDENGIRRYSEYCGSCHEDIVAIMFNNYREPTNEYVTLPWSRGLSELSEDW
jgi:hypothetical protein